jgi:hypothetical protein
MRGWMFGSVGAWSAVIGAFLVFSRHNLVSQARITPSGGKEERKEEEQAGGINLQAGVYYTHNLMYLIRKIEFHELENSKSGGSWIFSSTNRNS